MASMFTAKVRRSRCESICSNFSTCLPWKAALFTSRSMRPKSRAAVSINRALRLFGQIPGDEHHAPARFLDQATGLARIFVLVPVRDHDVRPFACKRERHGAADPAVRPGDHRHLVFQPTESFVRRFAVVRTGLHRRLAAWRLLLLLGKRRTGALVLGVRHARNLLTAPFPRITLRPTRSSYEIVAPGAPNDEAVRRARDAWTVSPREAGRRMAAAGGLHLNGSESYEVHRVGRA